MERFLSKTISIDVVFDSKEITSILQGEVFCFPISMHEILGRNEVDEEGNCLVDDINIKLRLNSEAIDIFKFVSTYIKAKGGRDHETRQA